MVVHQARIIVLGAVLVCMGACGRGERPGTQQTFDGVRAVAEPQRFLDVQRALTERGDAAAQFASG